MSRIKALGRLASLRKRQRDLAAAMFTVAEAKRLEAEGARDAAQAELAALDDSLGHRLGSGAVERELALFYDDRAGALAVIPARAKEANLARRDAVLARGGLVKQERALRTAETSLGNARTERDQRIDRHEQAFADDLAAGSAWRKR